MKKIIRDTTIIIRGTIINEGVQTLTFVNDGDKNGSSRKEIREAFDQLEGPAQISDLKINPTKTKYIHAGKTLGMTAKAKNSRMQP